MWADLHIATLLWEPNRESFDFSRCYDESWVLKLQAGFQRNLHKPFQFVLFTDRLRDLPASIQQRRLHSAAPTYADCIQPYQLNAPMILVGLDTVITGNIDHLAAHCLTADRVALPRDPFAPARACNGVALVPAGHRRIFDEWRGENDMEWMRAQPHHFIDDLFPGQVVSFKGQVRGRGLGDARIVYFHGQEKPHQLAAIDWIDQHWRI